MMDSAAWVHFNKSADWGQQPVSWKEQNTNYSMAIELQKGAGRGGEGHPQSRNVSRGSYFTTLSVNRRSAAKQFSPKGWLPLLLNYVQTPMSLKTVIQETSFIQCVFFRRKPRKLLDFPPTLPIWCHFFDVINVFLFFMKKRFIFSQCETSRRLLVAPPPSSSDSSKFSSHPDGLETGDKMISDSL